MANLPFRGLAAKGILRDPSPYELDLEAFSNGSNVRFHANKAERAPIWRTVYESLPEAPVYCAGLEPSTGYDTIMIVGVDGRTWRYVSGQITEVSALGVSTATITAGGSGYSSATPPTVTFSAPSVPGGRAATATAVVSTGGAVTGLTMTDHGFYPQGSSVPSVTFQAPSGGTSATATAVMEWSPSQTAQATTSTFLGDVVYINRANQQPQYFGPESTEFHVLPNMDSQWTCRSLRAWSDYLIALNVTKPPTWVDPYTGATVAGGATPNMFKWSDLTYDGAVPPSWDAVNPNTSAGENLLEELTTPLVDGLPMRGIFVIYSENDIWCAQQVDSNEIFAFSRLFSDGGMIAPNCAVEVAGIHYVFGPKDIYRHDGVTKQSIIDKRNKNTVFRNLNVQKSEVCFVRYVPHLDSIFFCYNTGDTNAAFQGVPYCNQAAVYDIPGDTWSFIDLPDVTAMSMANLDTILTWESAPTTTTWGNVGGSWYDQQNSYVKSAVGVSVSQTGLFSSSRLIAYDFMDKGWLSFPYEPELNAPAFLERTGLDLDQVGGDLTTYKLIRRVFPLVSMFGDEPVVVQVGGSMTPSGAATYAAPISFNPTTSYKVDVMKGGRYLAIRFTVNGAADFEVAGFDVDVIPNGSY